MSLMTDASSLEGEYLPLAIIEGEVAPPLPKGDTAPPLSRSSSSALLIALMRLICSVFWLFSSSSSFALTTASFTRPQHSQTLEERMFALVQM